MEAIHIADTISFPLEADDKIDDDDVGEDDVHEDDAEAEEAVVLAAIDKVESVKKFMESTKPFQRLREDICQFTLPNTR